MCEASSEEEAGEKDSVAKDMKIAELTADLKRLQAEFENFKKRNEKDWGEKVKASNQNLIRDLLCVLDSFDRALEDTKKNQSQSSMRAGLEGLHRQLLQTLQKEGLREIPTDCAFDPFIHEAVMRQEAEDAEEGRILEVFQKGYAIDSRAIRPAKVKVAKRREPPIQESQDQPEEDKSIEENKR